MRSIAYQLSSTSRPGQELSRYREGACCGCMMNNLELSPGPACTVSTMHSSVSLLRVQGLLLEPSSSSCRGCCTRDTRDPLMPLGPLEGTLATHLNNSLQVPLTPYIRRICKRHMLNWWHRHGCVGPSCMCANRGSAGHSWRRRCGSKFLSQGWS